MDWTLYWYMFPVAVGVSTLAMATGIEGATFFSPIFILALQLEPRVAIGAALITASFGFASGVSARIRGRLIDYRLAGELLSAAVPLAFVGAGFAGWFPPLVLKFIFGSGLLLIGIIFLSTPAHTDAKHLDPATPGTAPPERGERRLVNAHGEVIRYQVSHRAEGLVMCGVGGLFMGLIGSGQGAMNNYFLLRRSQIPSQVAIATGTLVVAITTLAASLGHMVSFLQTGSSVTIPVMNLVVFSVPAVIIGGQIGPRVASRLDRQMLGRLLAFVFILIGAITLAAIGRLALS